MSRGKEIIPVLQGVLFLCPIGIIMDVNRNGMKHSYLMSQGAGEEMMESVGWNRTGLDVDSELLFGATPRSLGYFLPL